MLEDLAIKNFALIDEASIEFPDGFTVLSGETGAGKSILIGALSFLLGGKADARLIRAGAKEASVSGTFSLEERSAPVGAEAGEAESALEWLKARGVEAEDGRVIARRALRDNGKSLAWIGGVPVSRADLESFSAFLVDMHGQHEHQLLMKTQEHRKFLDARAGITDEVRAFTAMYAELVEKRRALERMDMSEAQRERDMEMSAFALKEIDDARLKTGEDSALEEEEGRLSSYEKLCASVESLCESLSLGEGSAVQRMKAAMRESERAAEMDKSLSALSSRVESSFYEVSDIAEEFQSYKDSLAFDPDRLKEIQDRLSLIYSLKKKYASSPSAPLSEVIEYGEEARKKVEAFGGGAADKDALAADVSALEKKIYAKAKSLGEKRRAAADALSVEVEKILSALGMAGTKFRVSVVEKTAGDDGQKCGPYGMDDIEFLISANPGSPLMPLARIASGGELSRVMLALKTIFAESDPVGTLVFDEIDTGIGGEVAVEVGEHLKNLARGRQILCITHLASIAVCADNQIKIEKTVSGGRTFSVCRAVTGEERAREVARMLSGEESSESLGHARSMLAKNAR